MNYNQGKLMELGKTQDQDIGLDIDTDLRRQHFEKLKKLTMKGQSQQITVKKRMK